MPADLTVTRTEIAVWGAMLRGHARLLFGSRDRAARLMGCDLVKLADRFDPSHREKEMSERAAKEIFIVNQLDSADAEVERLEVENGQLRTALAEAQAAGSMDAEDVAANAAMDEAIARRTVTPVDAPVVPPVDDAPVG